MMIIKFEEKRPFLFSDTHTSKPMKLLRVCLRKRQKLMHFFLHMVRTLRSIPPTSPLIWSWLLDEMNLYCLTIELAIHSIIYLWLFFCAKYGVRVSSITPLGTRLFNARSSSRCEVHLLGIFLFRQLHHDQCGSNTSGHEQMFYKAVMTSTPPSSRLK